MGMEKDDARKQTREVHHERRKQVIRLHRKGMPVMRIVEHSGLSWYAVNAASGATLQKALAHSSQLHVAGKPVADAV